jgi:hypothetical protein
MRERIPKPAIALAALLLLQGCLAGFGSGKSAETVAVTPSEIVIAGPRGYCIDTASLAEGREGSFVLLASCAALSGAPDAPPPSIPGVLSAMVSADPDGTGFADALPGIEAFLVSGSGRAGLSRAGDAESVALLQSRIAGDVLLLNLRDESAFNGPEIEPEYWRAVLAVRGHIVTLSAMVPAGQSGNGALATLEAFIARVAQENAAPARDPVVGAISPRLRPTR